MRSFPILATGRLSNRYKILLGLSGLALILVFGFGDAIPQNPEYHQFADQRNLVSIPNALDVLSNLPFCLLGIIGVWSTLSRRQALQAYTPLYLTFFSAILLTGLGSGFYHLDPDNATLVWDRLPMAVAFTSILAILIAERIHTNLGMSLFPWLVIIGIGSVLYWHWLDDLRLYALVQFGALVALPIILLRYRHIKSKLLWLAIACYLAAKLLEFYDMQIYQLTSAWVSGHTLKHLAAAMSAYMILLNLNYQTNGALTNDTAKAALTPGER